MPANQQNDSQTEELSKSLVDRIKREIMDEIPRGVILHWYAKETAVVPNGWAICDGNNGTPNLQGLFLVSPENGEKLQTIKGTHEHSLSIPHHRHSLANGEGKNALAEEGGKGIIRHVTTQNHIVKAETVGPDLDVDNLKFDNRPKCITVLYIMKL